MVTRETEIINLLETESIDILFLTETDTKNLKKEDDYKIKGYSTIFHKRKDENSNLRLLCLIKTDSMKNIIVRNDLMTDTFPSIWLEFKQNLGENLLISGFYREWARDSDKSMEGQISRMKIFTKQIEQASEKNKRKNIIILGDANLDINKWNDPTFLFKSVSTNIREHSNKMVSQSSYLETPMWQIMLNKMEMWLKAP